MSDAQPARSGPPLPSVPLPTQADPSSLSRYGESLLEAIQSAAADSTRALGAASVVATQALLASLADITLAMQASNPATLTRQTSWWGRLLGRDVERQTQADGLQSRLGVLLLQAKRHAQALQAADPLHVQGIEHAHAAAQALEACCAAAAPLQAQLQHTDPAAADVLAQRLHHLQRLATLQYSEGQQRQLLHLQDQALVARFLHIHDVLLPAWQQAALVHTADGQQQRAVQAAALQAQISDEVAAAQARLR